MVDKNRCLSCGKKLDAPKGIGKPQQYCPECMARRRRAQKRASDRRKTERERLRQLQYPKNAKVDSYCPVRTIESVLGIGATSGMGGINHVQATTTKTIRRH